MQGNIYWKRPIDYIIDYNLSREIITRYPLRNLTKFKKFIYETYNRETCPFEIKVNKYIDTTPAGENKSDYSSDNKRTFKVFFKILDNVNYYVVKHLEIEEEMDKNSMLDNFSKRIL